MYLNNKGKHMSLIKILVIIIFSVVFIGCGGSDSQTSSSTVTVDENIVAPIPEKLLTIVDLEPLTENVPEIDRNAVYDTTAELVAEKTFTLSLEYDLQVNYLNINNQNIYLSVCTEFDEGKEGIKVNYESCLLKASITESFQATMKVPNDQNRIVMALWNLDNPQQPRFETWVYSIESDKQHIFTVN